MGYQKFTIKTDVWAFGVFMWEVMSGGSVPYPGMTNRMALQEIENGHRMKKPQGCLPVVYTIMLDCWRHIPDERPSFAQLSDKLESIYVELFNQANPYASPANYQGGAPPQ